MIFERIEEVSEIGRTISGSVDVQQGFGVSERTHNGRGLVFHERSW